MYCKLGYTVHSFAVSCRPCEALAIWSLLFACSQVQDSYGDHSFRLLALAVGVLPNVKDLDVQCMSQGQIEACAKPLQLLGIMVLTNPIDTDSKNVIAELQDR